MHSVLLILSLLHQNEIRNLGETSPPKVHVETLRIPYDSEHLQFQKTTIKGVGSISSY